MAALRINFLAIAAVAVLSACGGGGGDEGGGTPPPAPPSDNGLPYAADGQSLVGAEDTEVVAEGASFQVGSGPTLGAATIRVSSGFFAGAGATSSLNGTITIFGETVTIENGVGTIPITGEEVRLIFESDRVGTYVAAVDVAVSDVTDGMINGGGAYVFGYETSPATISTLGTTEYRGSFQAYGSLNGSEDTDTEYDGGILIIADFDSDVDVTLDGDLDDVGSMVLRNGSIPISGNSFSGGLSCPASGCDSTGSQISGTFYGPNAEEVGGVLSINATVGGQDYDGVGTFIIVSP